MCSHHLPLQNPPSSISPSSPSLLLFLPYQHLSSLVSLICTSVSHLPFSFHLLHFFFLFFLLSRLPPPSHISFPLYLLFLNSSLLFPFYISPFLLVFLSVLLPVTLNHFLFFNFTNHSIFLPFHSFPSSHLFFPNISLFTLISFSLFTSFTSSYLFVFLSPFLVPHSFS